MRSNVTNVPVDSVSLTCFYLQLLQLAQKEEMCRKWRKEQLTTATRSQIRHEHVSVVLDPLLNLKDRILFLIC